MIRAGAFLSFALVVIGCEPHAVRSDSTQEAELRAQSVQGSRDWEQRAADLPKTWPSAKYAFIWMTMKGQVELKNEAVEQDGKKMIRLTDSYAVKETLSAKRSIDATYVTMCKPDRYLTPIAVHSHGDHYESVKGPIDHKFEGGKLIGRYSLGKGDPYKEAQSDLDPPFVLDVALTRIAALMPFVKGVELKFSFVTTDGYPEKDHTLRCLGQEDVTIHEKTYKAWKVEHPNGPIGTDYYWVGENRVLLTAELARSSAVHTIIELIDTP